MRNKVRTSLSFYHFELSNREPPQWSRGRHDKAPWEAPPQSSVSQSPVVFWTQKEYLLEATLSLHQGPAVNVAQGSVFCSSPADALVRTMRQGDLCEMKYPSRRLEMFCENAMSSLTWYGMGEL